MALTTGGYTTYLVGTGNREDLSDVINDVSPSDTPFLTAIGRSKSTAVNHEFMTDALTAASSDNKHLEGADAVPVAPTAASRLGNINQIHKKWTAVTGTQEDGADPAGIKKMTAYQLERRLREIRTDVESSMIGGAAIGVIKAAGDATHARRMGSIYTYLTSNVSMGTNGVVSAGTGADLMTAGDDRDLTIALLNTVLSSCYTNGGNPNLLFVSPTNKGVVTDFTAGSATRYVSTEDKKLVNSVDVYVGDFHTLKVVPSRNLVGDNVLAIDPEYCKLAEMRGVQSYDLAKIGDSYRKEILWECTLEVCNEAAHGLVADTNG